MIFFNPFSSFFLTKNGDPRSRRLTRWRSVWEAAVRHMQLNQPPQATLKSQLFWISYYAIFLGFFRICSWIFLSQKSLLLHATQANPPKSQMSGLKAYKAAGQLMHWLVQWSWRNTAPEVNFEVIYLIFYLKMRTSPPNQASLKSQRSGELHLALTTSADCCPVSTKLSP